MNNYPINTLIFEFTSLTNTQDVLRYTLNKVEPYPGETMIHGFAAALAYFYPERKLTKITLRSSEGVDLPPNS